MSILLTRPGNKQRKNKNTKGLESVERAFDGADAPVSLDNLLRKQGKTYSVTFGGVERRPLGFFEG